MQLRCMYLQMLIAYWKFIVYSSYDDPSAQGAPRPQRQKKKPKTDQEANAESSTVKNEPSENSTPEAQASSSIVIEEYALNTSDDDFVMSNSGAS